MPSVGERLRAERMKQGRDLAQIASEIRVNQGYLEAIEEGQLNLIPGTFFARSFIRQYAAALGMEAESFQQDADEWLRESDQSRQILDPRAKQTGLPPVAHVREGGRKPRRHLLSAVAGLVVVVGGCAALYAFWLQSQTIEPSPILPDEPAETLSATGLEVEAELASPAETLPVVESEREEGEAVSEPSAANPISGKSPGEQSEEETLWFEIRGTEETWVRVTAGDQTLFVGILEDGDSRRFTDLSLASVRVGNAGGLLISFKGGEPKVVGPSGQIRIVTLTPSSVNIEPPQRVRRTPVLEGEVPEGE